MTAAAVQREKARLLAAFRCRGGDVGDVGDLADGATAEELDELMALRGRRETH